MTDADPGFFMRRAIRLAKRGFPAPNPHVGCVIALDGVVVGEGYHDHAGGLHAEAMALRQAGEKSRGATAYVTLEPCNHQGRQPPCSQALIAAKVSRVVFAVPDPNPKAIGGATALRRAGVEVVEGILEPEARRVAHQFLSAQERRRPLVVAKAAVGFDGRIALPSGESRWITGELARRQAHRFRAELGAVLVGRRTVEIDNPLLTARIPGVVNQPLRIVLDPGAKLGKDRRVFGPEAETWHVTGRIDLQQLLADLFERGITGLLIEGGAHTLSQWVAAGLVDRYELIVAPRILGSGPNWLDLPARPLLAQPELQFTNVKRLGRDVWLTAIPSQT